MTRKHFIALAAIICDSLMEAESADERHAIRKVRSDMADYFESVNPHFDRDRFIAATTPVVVE